MQLKIALPSKIEYVFGTVNGVNTDFKQDMSGMWYAEVEQSKNDLYVLAIEMVDMAGNRSVYDATLHYVLPKFVIDRTQFDIDERTEKAFINASDLCRIEKNIELIGEYVSVPVNVYTEWKIGDLPRVSDFKRIRDNVEAIRSGYAIRADTPKTPMQPLNTYRKWNDLERILYDVFHIYFRNLNNINYCGELTAGEEIGVI